MKLVALLAGLIACAFAWAAPHFLVDVGAAFSALWPHTNSQQFLALVTWNTIVAAPLTAGVLTVFRPLLGGVFFLAAAAAWGLLATRLPTGFDPQVLVPMSLSGFAAFAAFGAALRGYARRRAAQQPQSSEEMARERALRLEPSIEFGRPEEDEAPASTDGETNAEAEAEIVRPEPLLASETPAATPRRISALAVANLAMLVLLAGAMTVLLYSEYRSGALLAAFSSAVFEAPRDGGGAVEIGTPDPQLLAILAPDGEGEESPSLVTGSSEADAAAIVTTASVQRAADEPPFAVTGIRGAEVRVSMTPLAATDLMETAWADPFAYCAAVGTVDFPDRRYAGPAVVAAIADVLRVPVSSSPDRIKWRCFDGAVVGCASFEGPVCASTPSVAEMIEFCARNPGARNLQAPNGSWRCDGTRPAIAEGEAWPVDARGFLPEAWMAIPPPAMPAAVKG